METNHLPLSFQILHEKNICTVQETIPEMSGTAIHDQPGLINASGLPHPLARKCQALSMEEKS